MTAGTHKFEIETFDRVRREYFSERTFRFNQFWRLVRHHALAVEVTRRSREGEVRHLRIGAAHQFVNAMVTANAFALGSERDAARAIRPRISTTQPSAVSASRFVMVTTSWVITLVSGVKRR
jgi:hypothetical protein